MAASYRAGRSKPGVAGKAAVRPDAADVALIQVGAGLRIREIAMIFQMVGLCDQWSGNDWAD